MGSPGAPDAYGEGYDAGKGKAHFEVRNWMPGERDAGCGCDVCNTVRQVLVCHIRYAIDFGSVHPAKRPEAGHTIAEN